MQLLIDDKRKTITIPHMVNVEELMNFCNKMGYIRGWRIGQEQHADHRKFTLPSRDWSEGYELQKTEPCDLT